MGSDNARHTADASIICDTESSPKPLPGDVAIWLFIFAELLVFGIFFISYAVVRSDQLALFNALQRTLDHKAGAINTALLISASAFIVCAIHAVKAGMAKASRAWMLAALVCAGIFVVLKGHGFYVIFAAGITLSTNVFFMFYLSMTFFHYMHVILGAMILLALYRNLCVGRYTPTSMVGLESGAAYWHMVDLVWIVLFPLVYVVR